VERVMAYLAERKAAFLNFDAYLVVYVDVVCPACVRRGLCT
jgi:hypothetical protein